MPVYSFRCEACAETTDVLRSVERRGEPVICSCGRAMTRCVELFQPDHFVPHHDEALGVDFESRAEKKAVLKAMGLEEAGDTVHGGRNFDSSAPQHIGQSKPKGIKYTIRRQGDFPVDLADAKGNTQKRVMFNDLEDA